LIIGFIKENSAGRTYPCKGFSVLLVRKYLYANHLTFLDSCEKLLVSNLRKVEEKKLLQYDSLEYREIMTTCTYPL